MTAENKKWVSEHLGVPERDVETMASRLSASDRSLNAPLAVDGDAQWQDLLPDESATPDQVVMKERDNAKRKEWISEALQVLNERETLIISERRLTDDTVTLEVLGFIRAKLTQVYMELTCKTVLKHLTSTQMLNQEVKMPEILPQLRHK